MKSKLFYLFVVMMMFMLASCSNRDINGVEIKNETVTYKFIPKTSEPSVEVTPMSKSTSLDIKTIYYAFVGGGDSIHGNVLEGQPIHIDLKVNKTYKYYLHSTPDNVAKDVVYTDTSDIYGLIGNLTTKDSGDSVKLELTRQVGQFTAKVGKIPTGAEMNFVINYHRNLSVPDFTSSMMANPASSTIKDNTSFFVAPGKKVVYVKATIIKNGNIIKEGEYSYDITANTKTTVTYNINQVGGDGNSGTSSGDLSFVINPEWENENLGGNQQVGKPQPETK
ncbi:MAG: hypothetical protein ACRDD8_15655 [Bacteroidales bacterium]